MAQVQCPISNVHDPKAYVLCQRDNALGAKRVDAFAKADASFMEIQLDINE